MKNIFPFDSLLVPIPCQYFLYQGDNTLKNAISIATWFQAELHLMTPSKYISKLLQDLKRISRNDLTFYLHESLGDFLSDIMNALTQNQISLLVVRTDRVSFLNSDFPFTWEQEILEKVKVPILIFPNSRYLSKIPFESLLVPLSAEAGVNSALRYAFHIADDKQVPIDLIHVSEYQKLELFDSSLLGQVSDHFHHEYPSLVDRLISINCPFSDVRKKRLIREFWHCYGDHAQEIIVRTEKKHLSLLVLEWKGKWGCSQAKIIKKILNHYFCPILLVREAMLAQSTLKVGENFKALLS